MPSRIRLWHLPYSFHLKAKLFPTYHLGTTCASSVTRPNSRSWKDLLCNTLRHFSSRTINSGPVKTMEWLATSSSRRSSSASEQAGIPCSFSSRMCEQGTNNDYDGSFWITETTIMQIRTYFRHKLKYQRFAASSLQDRKHILTLDEVK